MNSFITIITVALIGLMTAFLGACTSTGPLTSDQLKQAINNAATLADAGCTIVQPTLTAGAVASANPVAGAAAGVNGVFCASQKPLMAATAASAPVAASAPSK